MKLQLQGQMVCRLGMLLLGPSNVKVLGGEVEDLVERNSGVSWWFCAICLKISNFFWDNDSCFPCVLNIFIPLWQGRVLCRALGIPEEEGQQPQEEEEEVPLAAQQGTF